LVFLLRNLDKESTTPLSQRRIQHILDLLHYLVFYPSQNRRAAANLRLCVVFASYCCANLPDRAALATYCYANLHSHAVLAMCNQG
jgi:hypothetical protein